MKKKYVEHKFTRKKLELLAHCQVILDDYAKRGYDLTVRQLYYQLVTKNIIPNEDKIYKNLGGLISNGRRAGLIDWDAIVDRGRNRITHTAWDNPGEIVAAAASSYRIDMWEHQPVHVEVMIEKQALEGVLAVPCKRMRVPYTANKGYSSDSELYRLARRLRRYVQDGKDLGILYLGDHDPSGMDMDRDITERLALFGEFPEHIVRVERIALTMDQIEEYAPPENPAKETDSRYEKYVARTNTESSWELDALDPEVIDELVGDQVSSFIDLDQWEDDEAREAAERKLLLDFANQWKKENPGNEDDETEVE